VEQIANILVAEPHGLNGVQILQLFFDALQVLTKVVKRYQNLNLMLCFHHVDF
jgi:hypothetical protein